MISKLKLSASVAALGLLVAGAVSSAQAADIVADQGCTLSGSVTAGFMYDWQSSNFDFDDESIDGKDVDWDTPFGEGAGLVTCGGFNAQADVAYYAHSAEIDISGGGPFSSELDLDQTNTHIGGALFYRDPASWAGGLQASWISQDVMSKDVDIFRVGLFGEFYLNDMITFGGNVAYYNSDGASTIFSPFGKDEDGFELAAWGKFYATPDLALTLRGDLLLATIEQSVPGESQDNDFDGFAITGDAEYLVWDQGLSLLGGARYAERQIDPDNGDGEVTVEDFQVFAGIKFNFGQGGTLLERQRTGTVDNTSLWNEKLPNVFTSILAAQPQIP